MLLYMVITKLRKRPSTCAASIPSPLYLSLHFITTSAGNARPHSPRLMRRMNPFRSLNFLVHTQLYIPHIVIQIFLGTLTPIVLLAITQVMKLREIVRKRIYVVAGCLTMIESLPCAGTSSSAASCSQRAFSATPPTRWPWSREKACCSHLPHHPASVLPVGAHQAVASVD